MCLLCKIESDEKVPLTPSVKSCTILSKIPNKNLQFLQHLVLIKIPMLKSIPDIPNLQTLEIIDHSPVCRCGCICRNKKACRKSGKELTNLELEQNPCLCDCLSDKCICSSHCSCVRNCICDKDRLKLESIPSLRSLVIQNSVLSSIPQLDNLVKLTFENVRIPDIKGSFANLEEISISKCTFSCIEIQSKKVNSCIILNCTKLEQIHIRFSPIKILKLENCNELNIVDITSCVHLYILNCKEVKELPYIMDQKTMYIEGTNIKSVYPSPTLEHLQIYSDELESISFCKNLRFLDCSYCPRLLNIDEELKLKRLSCNYCPSLKGIHRYNSLTELSCDNSNIFNIDCPNLRKLYCSNNNISYINLPFLEELNITNNPVRELYLQNIVRLTINSCKNLQNIDFNKYPYLKYLVCMETPLQIISSSTLEHVNCNSSGVYSIICPALQELSCSRTNIVNLELLTNLKRLIYNNSHSSFKIPPNLEYLECTSSNITEISGNMKKVYCAYSKVEFIDCPQMEYLYCVGTTQLKNIVNPDNLVEMDCSYSSIYEISTDFKKLKRLVCKHCDLISIVSNTLYSMQCENCYRLESIICPELFRASIIDCPKLNSESVKVYYNKMVDKNGKETISKAIITHEKEEDKLISYDERQEREFASMIEKREKSCIEEMRKNGIPFSVKYKLVN